MRDIQVSQQELADLYSIPEENIFNCLTNEYIIANTEDGQQIPFIWNGEKYEQVKRHEFHSRQLGSISPKGNDPYQLCYADSLVRNQLTFCTAPAGSGKTLLALAYAFSQMERGKLEKIVIFTNPYIAKGAVKLGFMPGTKEEKLFETSIGNILSSKLGGETALLQLINQEKIVLIPMGDARGYEVPPYSYVFFTEAQNLNKYLMKLFLQRLNDTSQVCVEGDVRQIDSNIFAGEENGLQRAIEVFKGEDYAAHIYLRNIYRSRIANKAEEI